MVNKTDKLSSSRLFHVYPSPSEMITFGHFYGSFGWLTKLNLFLQINSFDAKQAFQTGLLIGSPKVASLPTVW